VRQGEHACWVRGARLRWIGLEGVVMVLGGGLDISGIAGGFDVVG